jgi:hypothetical protein
MVESISNDVTPLVTSFRIIDPTSSFRAVVKSRANDPAGSGRCTAPLTPPLALTTTPLLLLKGLKAGPLLLDETLVMGLLMGGTL